MDYGKIIKKQIYGEEISYGIIYGNEKLVFIKTGADGNIYGYNNKYLKAANRIYSRLGATVICASNPFTEQGHEDTDLEAIEEIAKEYNFSNYEIYFIGTSDGVNHNLNLAAKTQKGVKLLGINPSSISYEDFKEKLERLPNLKKILVYGTKDYEYDNALLLKERKIENLEIITVTGADHSFRGMEEEFIKLTDLL